MAGTRGLKGIFSTEGTIAKQWSYTNAPDAEDRAIQAIYAANRWGVGDSNLTTLAGKMGDQLRNNMFDKYYKKIGCQDKWAQSGNGYDGAHYLMSWYTSWGGALDGSWTWQIGASHCHEFYQNPLAAFALLQDNGLKNAMKGQDAVKDYTTSLQRQMEFYLWLQSANGPIAGGATSSWNGRYEAYKYNETDAKKYGTDVPTTFYDMGYQEHPVYLDPGSNHWIGNQVWAVQRLAEMYYVIKENGDTTGVTAGGLTLEEALKVILDRWVEWFVSEVNLYDDGTFDIPSTLDWSGQPKTWNGTYDPNANADLTCTVTARGSSDLGCVSSLAHTLIYYAKAHGVETEAAYSDKNTDVASKALYVAHSLLDREWQLGRDDIGLSITETNGSMVRLFEQEVWVPSNYNGTMPGTQGTIKQGVKFLDFRQDYLKNEKVQEFKEAYDEAVANGTDKTEAMESVELNYHRFWHAGDILLALGTMYELYPDMEPDKYDTEPDPDPDALDVEEKDITVEVGDTATIKPNKDGCSFESSDPSIAEVDENGVVTGIAAGETTVIVSKGDETVTVNVTVVEPFYRRYG